MMSTLDYTLHTAINHLITVLKILMQSYATYVTRHHMTLTWGMGNWEILYIRHMSQVTCGFPQACHIGNLQMAARQVINFRAHSADW